MSVADIGTNAHAIYQKYVSETINGDVLGKANGIIGSDGIQFYYYPVVISQTFEIVGYVNNANVSAYPPIEDDGYTYTLLGKTGSLLKQN